MYFYAHIHDLHLLNFLLVWIVDLHLFNFLLVSIVRSKAWNRSISWGAWTTKSKASQFGMLLIFFWGHSYLYCWVLQWDTHPPPPPVQIFIPVVHDDHWFLIVFSREEDTFYVLDSLPSLSRISTINGIISTLKEHLQQASVGPQYSVKVLPVKRQDNK